MHARVFHLEKNTIVNKTNNNMNNENNPSSENNIGENTSDVRQKMERGESTGTSTSSVTTTSGSGNEDGEMESSSTTNVGAMAAVEKCETTPGSEMSTPAGYGVKTVANERLLTLDADGIPIASFPILEYANILGMSLESVLKAASVGRLNTAARSWFKGENLSRPSVLEGATILVNWFDDQQMKIKCGLLNPKPGGGIACTYLPKEYKDLNDQHAHGSLPQHHASKEGKDGKPDKPQRGRKKQLIDEKKIKIAPKKTFAPSSLGNKLVHPSSSNSVTVTITASTSNSNSNNNNNHHHIHPHRHQQQQQQQQQNASSSNSSKAGKNNNNNASSTTTVATTTVASANQQNNTIQYSPLFHPFVSSVTSSESFFHAAAAHSLVLSSTRARSKPSVAGKRARIMSCTSDMLDAADEDLEDESMVELIHHPAAHVLSHYAMGSSSSSVNNNSAAIAFRRPFEDFVDRGIEDLLVD